jgi:hypothetical protein
MAVKSKTALGRAQMLSASELDCLQWSGMGSAYSTQEALTWHTSKTECFSSGGQVKDCTGAD